MTRGQAGIRMLACLVTSLAMAPAAWAFDGDLSIESRIFKPENFLDIQASALRPNLRRQWLDVENGVLVSGASMDSHRLALQSEIYIKQSLAPRVDARVALLENSFYKITPTQRPLFELAYRAWGVAKDLPLEVSLIGSPAYDKRQADLGFAVTLGSRPRDYLRFEYLSQEHFYNQKNVYDDSRYERAPKLIRVEADYWLSNALRTRLTWQRSRRLEFEDPNQSLEFRHSSNEFNLSLDYQYNAETWLGAAYHGLSVKKALADLEDNQQQHLQSEFLDLYWEYQKGPRRQWIVGSRFDLFENTIDDRVSLEQSQDYRFSTWQIYSNYIFTYAPNKALDYGLYMGDVRERMRFGPARQGGWNDTLVETKLRIGWEYFSSLQESRLMLYLSLNLDDVINDPGDGGGMRYVTQF